MRYPYQSLLTFFIARLLFRTDRFWGSKNPYLMKGPLLSDNPALRVPEIQNVRDHYHPWMAFSLKTLLCLISFWALSNVVHGQTLTTDNFGPVTFCPGASFFVSYTITGTFNAGNEFRVQLSDATGNYASPTTMTLRNINHLINDQHDEQYTQ